MELRSSTVPSDSVPVAPVDDAVDDQHSDSESAETQAVPTVPEAESQQSESKKGPELAEQNIIMAKRKTAKKPGTNKSGDKSQSQTESENDTNNGSEEEMETDDNVDGSGISSAESPAATCDPSPFKRSPLMTRHQTSYAKSPASTCDYFGYRSNNQSVFSNTSSAGSDLENLASPASKSTDHSFLSSPRETRQATREFRLFDLTKHESQSADNESYESSPLPSKPKDVKVDKVQDVRVDKVQDVRVDKGVSQNNTNWYYVVIGLVAIFVAFIISNKTEAEASYNQFQKFVQNIDNFKSQFPAQENRFWRTVKASGKHVLNVTSPDYPAILLFVTNSKPANDDQFNVGSCLARKISAEFDSANMVTTSGSPIVDVGKLTTGSPQKQKMEFDEQLRSFLMYDHKSVIVEHLELLTPAAALLLHGYCDNDNAPYKDVMIILVLHVENDNINPRAAEALLKQSWERELETDKVDALMSRVANNIVIVHPESISSSSQCD